SIQALPAGCWLTVGERGASEPKKFIDIAAEYRQAEEAARTGNAMGTLEHLTQTLSDSVAHHMVADVPVGVFLSAGIDSSVIAALAAEVTPHLSTITLAFDEYAGTEDDEAPVAEATARLLGSAHVTTRIGREEFLELVDRFIQSMDQPT